MTRISMDIIMFGMVMFGSFLAGMVFVALAYAIWKFRGTE